VNLSPDQIKKLAEAAEREAQRDLMRLLYRAGAWVSAISLGVGWGFIQQHLWYGYGIIVVGGLCAVICIKKIWQYWD